MTINAGSSLRARSPEAGEADPAAPRNSPTRSPVMRKPERTKNTSTPKKPPSSPPTPKWKARTKRTATARSPSRPTALSLPVADGRAASGPASRVTPSSTAPISTFSPCPTVADRFRQLSGRSGSVGTVRGVARGTLSPTVPAGAGPDVAFAAPGTEAAPDPVRGAPGRNGGRPQCWSAPLRLPAHRRRRRGALRRQACSGGPGSPTSGSCSTSICFAPT